MPDISMCANSNCPSSELCYRFTATPNPFRQSYGLFTVQPGQSRCDNFTPNERVSVTAVDLK